MMPPAREAEAEACTVGRCSFWLCWLAFTAGLRTPSGAERWHIDGVRASSGDRGCRASLGVSEGSRRLRWDPHGGFSLLTITRTVWRDRGGGSFPRLWWLSRCSCLDRVIRWYSIHQLPCHLISVSGHTPLLATLPSIAPIVPLSTALQLRRLIAAEAPSSSPPWGLGLLREATGRGPVPFDRGLESTEEERVLILDVWAEYCCSRPRSRR